jgi:hypothetical protein
VKANVPGSFIENAKCGACARADSDAGPFNVIRAGLDRFEALASAS